MAAGPETDEDGNEQWRFSLDEIAAREQDGDSQVGTDDQSEGNIAGSIEQNEPLEPGDIDLENAIFVVFGALLVLVLIAGVILGL